MQTGASFTTLDFDAGERFVRLRQELGVESFGLNLMLLEPGQRGRVHRHERQEEVYVVLEGTLTLELEGGETHTLEPRDAARVAPDVRRQLSNRGSERVALLALGGAHPHEGATASPSPTGTTTRASRPRTFRSRPTCKPESSPAFGKNGGSPLQKGFRHVDHGRAAQEQRGVRASFDKGELPLPPAQEGRRASRAWTRA